MGMNESTYSAIIGPAEYNQLIAQHLYIGDADKEIQRLIRGIAALAPKRELQVTEVGCGPARIMPLIAAVPGVILNGIDHDHVFVAYGRRLLQDKSIDNAKIWQADALKDGLFSPDIVISQGFHHHVKKGKEVQRYLKNVFDQLMPGGYSIVGDEFLPFYQEYDRPRRLVIWYSHIIDNAIVSKNGMLAMEEAKTLLDDLAEGSEEETTKSSEQIALVLRSVRAINSLAVQGNTVNCDLCVFSLIKQLKELQGTTTAERDDSMDLSRGDYKIDHQRFAAEVEEAGFSIVNEWSAGPIETIGGMKVYLLRKPC